jgi:phage shock protein C
MPESMVPPSQLPTPRLWRSRSNRVVLGVIGGLAERFGWETRPVRILWGLFGVLTLPLGSLPVLVPYITLWTITRARGPAGPPRAFRRSSTDQVVSGVLAGVADWLGLRPKTVRIVYSALTVVTAGLPGIVVYLMAWAKMRVADAPSVSPTTGTAGIASSESVLPRAPSP